MLERALSLTTVSQILVPVNDLERAVAFYRDTLGMPFLFEAPRMAFFELERMRLVLGQREGEGSGHGSIVYFRAKDLVETCRDLETRGVSIAQGPTLIAEMDDHDLWMAFFHDTEGNQLALTEERPKG